MGLDFFSKKKIGGGEDFFYKFENPILIFQKNIFEHEKVICVGSIKSSVFISVWYIIHGVVFMTLRKAVFGRNTGFSGYLYEKINY